MKLGTNLMAVQTSTALEIANMQMAKSSARLSSGVKLNSSADGSAAIAIVSKMKIKHIGVGMASRNASDAMSLTQTADSAVSQIRDMVNRIRELSVQAGNDTLGDADREKIQQEIDYYKEEITSTANRTEYNRIKILTGEADNLCTPSNNVRAVKISDTVKPGTYNFTINSLGTAGPPATDASVSLGNGFETAEPPVIEGNKLTVTDVDGRKIILDLSNAKTGDAKLEIERRGLIFQVGADKSMETRVTIPKVNTETLELDSLSVATWQDADDALVACDKAIAELSRYSARIGAYINRMEYTNSNLETTSLGLEESMSRIKDTDMAREMVEYTRAQILVQADISMLAQANQRPQQLLQLFQR